MIELHQEQDPISGEIKRMEVTMLKPASEREFAAWCDKNNRCNKTTVLTALYTLPALIYDFIMDTGRSLRLEDYGIIKLKVRNNKIIVNFHNNTALTKRLNKETYMIRHFTTIDRKRIYCGGRMGKPNKD